MLVFGYTVVAGDVDDNGIWTGDESRTMQARGGHDPGHGGRARRRAGEHAAEGEHTDHKVNGAAANTAAMGAPTITGTAQVGQTLTAVTTGITDANGLTSVTYTYQWIRVDGGTEADITGANSSTYDLVAADQGKTIKVKVSFTDDGGNAETLTSAATATVTPVTPTLLLAEGIEGGALQVAPSRGPGGEIRLEC